MKFKIVEKIKDSFDINVKDTSYIPGVSEKIAKELFDFLQSFVPQDNLNESFISDSCAKNHFKWHCVGNRNKKSTRQTVYYDFTEFKDYLNYERELNIKFNDPDIEFNNLLSSKNLDKAFRKLFEGNYTIRFNQTCGFTNKFGKTVLCLNSFATDKTNNYLDSNTINLCILTPALDTITLYPIDANYLENKLNNIIASQTSSNIKFKFD